MFTPPVPDIRSDTLIPIMVFKVQPDSVVYTDSYNSYDVLDITDFKNYRVNHSKLFADKGNHINEIENFWNQAKHLLRKYNAVSDIPVPLDRCKLP